MAKESLTPYKMNLPAALKARIEDAAASNRRSMSAEIITRLEDSFGLWGSYSGETRNSYVMGAAVATLEIYAGIAEGHDRDVLLEALQVLSNMDVAGRRPTDD